MTKNFKIYTFRGYQYADTSEEAISSAIKMIEDIQNNIKDKTLWWARIEDYTKVTTHYKYITSVDKGQISSTSWIR